jgi:hypothetical protein
VTDSSILPTAGQHPRCLEAHHRVRRQRFDECLLTFDDRMLTSTHEDSVRLYCTVPTWSPSSNICMELRTVSPHIIDTDILGVDLHDLNALRSRSLHFIHDLVNSLRESGVRRNLVDNRSTAQMFSESRSGRRTSSCRPIHRCV